MMEFFINELSLQGQFHSDEAFTVAAALFIGILNDINKKIKEKKLYKDSLFVNSRAIRSEHFQSSVNHIRRKDVREVFKWIIFNKINLKDWRDERTHSADTIYLCPDLDDLLVTDTSIAEVAERNLLNPEVEKILINFISSSFGALPCSAVRVIKETPQPIAIDVPFIEKKEELQKWIDSQCSPLDLYLRNKEKFKNTGRIIQGRSIYEEIETNHLWYLDNLHKNHFEVFDRNKIHRGEANLEGKLLEETRDPRKDNKIGL